LLRKRYREEVVVAGVALRHSMTDLICVSRVEGAQAHSSSSEHTELLSKIISM